jgi:hypothetical protein
MARRPGICAGRDLSACLINFAFAPSETPALEGGRAGLGIVDRKLARG